MKLLITAGNTQTPIDSVRCITNIFSGKTGAMIAWEGARSGHEVTFLTSHPEVLAQLRSHLPDLLNDINVRTFQTFDDLHGLMAAEIQGGSYDVIIHAAAVSDFLFAGAFAPADGTEFATGVNQWKSDSIPSMVDVGAGKIKSNHSEVWIRLTPTPKLVDRIRKDWKFRGTLVKFKLEVGLSDAELVEVASQARAQSDADLIVANTLESMHEKAFIIDRHGSQRMVPRQKLASALMNALESSRVHPNP